MKSRRKRWSETRLLDCFLVKSARHHKIFSPPQILTKDSVTVFVNAIMYYKVKNTIAAVANVDKYSGSASPKQHLSREQQHHHLPHPYWHHLPADAYSCSPNTPGPGEIKGLGECFNKTKLHFNFSKVVQNMLWRSSKYYMWNCALFLECINGRCRVTLIFYARNWFDKKMPIIPCIWKDW